MSCAVKDKGLEQPFVVQVEVGTCIIYVKVTNPTTLTVCESINGVTDLNTLCHLKEHVLLEL
jgi:hypothetical protein